MSKVVEFFGEKKSKDFKLLNSSRINPFLYSLLKHSRKTILHNFFKTISSQIQGDFEGEILFAHPVDSNGAKWAVNGTCGWSYNCA